MDFSQWGYFLLGVVVYQFLKAMAQIVNQMVIEHRRKRVIRLAKVKFPDHTSITFAAVDSSDKRAMDKVIKQLIEQGDLHEEDLEDHT